MIEAESELLVSYSNRPAIKIYHITICNRVCTVTPLVKRCFDVLLFLFTHVHMSRCRLSLLMTSIVRA